ncbi:hypothetical protein Tco_1227889 [Tanacetum coccineum]
MKEEEDTQRIINDHHLLLFDLVNEALLEIHNNTYTYCPHPLTYRSNVHPMPVGFRVLEEVWDLVNIYLRWNQELQPSLDDAVSRDLAKGDEWMNLQADAEFVGIELEEMIADDLLDELNADSTGYPMHLLTIKGLQCSWNDGFPHYAFTTDKKKVYITSNLMKVDSCGDKNVDYVYVFHSRAKKSTVLGEMSVSTSSELCPHVGGWGLKFLRKDGYCESCKESTGINVIVPAGFHGGPRIGNNNGPSSLVERWTSGGSCDCGGWDLGCPLTVLHAQPTCQYGFGECFSFDLYVQGGKQSVPVLKMVDVSGGAYDFRYKSTLSPLQALSIAVAAIHSRSPIPRPIYYAS